MLPIFTNFIHFLPQIQPWKLSNIGAICGHAVARKLIRLRSQPCCFEVVPVQSPQVQQGCRMQNFAESSDQFPSHRLCSLQMSLEWETGNKYLTWHYLSVCNDLSGRLGLQGKLTTIYYLMMIISQNIAFGWLVVNFNRHPWVLWRNLFRERLWTYLKKRTVICNCGHTIEYF